MSYKKNLQVPYHQQDTHYYCGAASAQMVLASQAVGAGILDQDGLYSDNHSHTNYDQNLYDALGHLIEWSTPPDGLTWTLNDRRPTSFNGIFVEFPFGFGLSTSTEDVASRKIAWTIEHYGVAPCALVMGAQHWIVIRGIDVSKAPTSSGDTGYTINGFRVNNPWPPVPSWNMVTKTRDPALAPPPPHSGTDNCGIGPNRGVADELITYNQWTSTYMTGANYHPQGHWQGQFVAVCDPDPPATRRGPSIARIRRFDGQRIISREEAIRVANEILEKRELPDDEPWVRSLRGVKPADAVLVQRLDRLDEHYYFVPLVTSERAATMALSFDARYGDLQQAISFPKPEPRIVSLPSKEAVLKQVVEKSFELERYRGSLRIRDTVTTVLDHWFWKPCMESLSPFWPFKMIISGGNIVYMRIDGQIFTTLHEDGCGI